MTTYPQPKEPAVRALFGRIAPRYDLLNRLMTFGQDLSWRKQAIRLLEIPATARVLDVGAGTGDLSLLIHQSHPGARIVAVDLTPGMLAVARQRCAGKPIDLVIADAQHLPFEKSTFDRVVSAFLLRNVTSMIQTLKEQSRVMNAQGRIVAMETTPPRKSWLRPLAVFHLRRIIPFLGWLIAGDVAAYRYLPQSIEDFVSGERMAECVEKAGFANVGCRFRMMGTVSIVFGQHVLIPNKKIEKNLEKKRKTIKHR
jgi:demethylmenaquinone methyltransferase / 2-methoxy-6-polyprenyl-1,4-benzoquinol methylase